MQKNINYDSKQITANDSFITERVTNSNVNSLKNSRMNSINFPIFEQPLIPFILSPNSKETFAFSGRPSSKYSNRNSMDFFNK